MRTVVPLILVVAVAGCMAAPPQQPAALTANEQTRLSQLLSGKVAGAPQACLPSWRARDMTIVNESTLVFRQTSGQVWVQTPQSPCNLLSPGYALVTERPTPSLCRGDIARVIDPVTGSAVGTCVIGDFVPYTAPGA